MQGDYLLISPEKTEADGLYQGHQTALLTFFPLLSPSLRGLSVKLRNSFFFN